MVVEKLVHDQFQTTFSETEIDELDVIQDDWIKMEVVMTYNRSVVDNLVPTNIEETLPGHRLS